MENLIEFMELVSSLKELQRSGWKFHRISGILETTASHTFGVLFFVWLFAKKERVDTEKILKMALVHDLLESITGDFTPRDVGASERYRIEKKALSVIGKKLPEELRDEITSLIKEFHTSRTKESKIVRVCDRLDTVFQAYFYKKSNRGNESILSEFFNGAEKVCSEGLARELLNQLRN